MTIIILMVAVSIIRFKNPVSTKGVISIWKFWLRFIKIKLNLYSCIWQRLFLFKIYQLETGDFKKEYILNAIGKSNKLICHKHLLVLKKLKFVRIHIQSHEIVQHIILEFVRHGARRRAVWLPSTRWWIRRYQEKALRPC